MLKVNTRTFGFTEGTSLTAGGEPWTVDELAYGADMLSRVFGIHCVRLFRDIDNLLCLELTLSRDDVETLAIAAKAVGRLLDVVQRRLGRL